MNMEEIDKGLPNSSSQARLTPNTEYRTYKIRWYILLTLAILNISNAMIWLAFAPIAYVSKDFYDTTLNTINMLSVVFMLTAIPCGICATWLMDTFGLRWSLILGSLLNCVGAIIRVVSALDGINDSARLPVVFVGQTLAAFAQPFMLFAPTKLASVWFPEDQRALANTLASMSNPLGIMLASITSPILANDSSQVLRMLYVQAIPAVVAAVMACFGVCRSEPKSPPSASAENETMPFWTGIKKLFRNKYYLLLTWGVGGGIAFFSVLITLLSQIICPWGYDDNFAGVVCGGSMITAGFIGAAIAGIIVDKTKRFMEVVKICFSIAALALILFAIMQNHVNQGVVIAISCGIFGFFGLPVYPIGNELGVETTYPVGEASSSGILFMFGQILGIILVVVCQSLGREMSPDELTYSACVTSNSTETGEPTVVYDMSGVIYHAGYFLNVDLLHFMPKMFYNDARKAYLLGSIAKFLKT